MAREFIILRGRRFTGPATRRLTSRALLVFALLHFQPDLTAAGTVMTNVGRLAIAATDLDIGEVAKALVELEDAGLILTDTCTQELAIASFWDGGPELRNPNHVRGAVRAFQAIESEPLRAAVYEAAPPILKEAIGRALESHADAIAMPSPSHRDPSLQNENENENENETRAVVQAFWQQCAAPRLDGEDQDSRLLRGRVQAAAEELARRRAAPGGCEFGAALDEQWRRWGERLADLAGDFPDWSGIDLANAVDFGAFSA